MIVCGKMSLCFCCSSEIEKSRAGGIPQKFWRQLMTVLSADDVDRVDRVLCSACSARLHSYCRLVSAAENIRRQIIAVYEAKSLAPIAKQCENTDDVIDDVIAGCLDDVINEPMNCQSSTDCDSVNIRIVSQPHHQHHLTPSSLKPANVPLQHVCCDCGAKFDDKRQLTAHVRLEHTSSDAKLGANICCQLCSKYFRSRARYLQHLSVHCDQKLLPCPLCSHKFKSVLALRDHLQCHPGSDQIAVCDLCGLRFVSVSRLRTHEARAHGIEKPWRCLEEGCERAFKSAASLQLHGYSHGGQPSHVCAICQKRFASRRRLNLHTRVHTGEKPYQCEFCGKMFAHQPNLCQHMTLHRRQNSFDPVIESAHSEATLTLNTG